MERGVTRAFSSRRLKQRWLSLRLLPTRSERLMQPFKEAAQLNIQNDKKKLRLATSSSILEIITLKLLYLHLGHSWKFYSFRLSGMCLCFVNVFLTTMQLHTNVKLSLWNVAVFISTERDGSYDIRQNNTKQKMLRVYYFLIKRKKPVGQPNTFVIWKTARFISAMPESIDKKRFFLTPLATSATVRRLSFYYATMEKELKEHGLSDEIFLMKVKLKAYCTPTHTPGS